MEKAFENQILQQNQINDTTADISEKESATVSNFDNSTFSVKPEVEIQISKKGKQKKTCLKNPSSINSLKKVKYNPTKVKNDERDELLENYLRNSEEKRKTHCRKRGSSITNIELGITEYVFRNQGFITAIKGRYQGKDKADFQVRPVLENFDSGADYLGEVKMNRFTIALRKVTSDQCHIEMCLKSLKEFGFINYYESQELFGHLIGKELLLEHWQEAIDLILEEWLMSLKPSNFALACFVYTSSRDVLKAVSMMDENQIAVPSKLLFSIKQNGGNLAEALDTLPLKLRQSYVHAYQYFIWNKIVSKRIAKFGSKVIVGDLVFSQDNNNNGQHNQREVILIDDGNIHKYTIFDVVLPLPGPDTIYPVNEDIDWYDDLFKAEGISERDFNLKSKTSGLVGGYRPMLLRPSDLKWKFVRYDHRRQNLFLSDLEQQLAGQPPVSSLPGAHLGVVLEFDLPAFGFASMALREILKMDKNEETLKNPTPLLELNQKRSAANDLQIKETNDDLCPIKTISEHPVSEIENCGLDSPSTSGLCQASPPRKIKLESGALDKHLSMDSPLEQPTPCPSSTSESQLNRITPEEHVTIQNHCSRPPYLEMITKAVIALKELNGSSRQAILQYILANFHVGTDSKSANRRLKQALKRGVTLGTLEHIGGAKGAAGSFRLSAEAPKKVDKKVKPVAAYKEPKMVKKAACPKKAKAVSKKAPAAATRKQMKETHVKKEPAANERPAAITKDSSEDPQKNKNHTPLREPFTSQECPAAKDDNLCRIDEQPVSEINNSVLHSPSPLRKIKLESGTLDKQPSMGSLVEQPIPCPPSTSECQPKEIPLEMTDTIQNLQPATKKPGEEHQVKKEPAANEQPAAITKDSSEELQKNRSVLERSTSNQMPQLIKNESLEETQTKCVKEEPGISRTRSSTFIESCVEEPAIKKVKADPDANPSKPF